MEAIRYIIDTLLWLLTLAFVLRLILQLVRANFRDPMADAVLRVTNWLILPLRRVLPPVAKIDTATVLAVLLAACLHEWAMLALGGIGLGAADLPAFALIVARGLAEMVLKIYLFSLLLYWVTSVVTPGGYSAGAQLLSQICEPVLKRVRRVIPPIGQIDFSFLWVSIAIVALLILLR